MNAVILSSTQFGLRCLLEAVAPTPGVVVTGIVTTADTLDISYSDRPVSVLTHASFVGAGRDLGCPVVVYEKSKGAQWLRDAVINCAPDLILVLGWYYFVPAAVRREAARGCLGIHASLLPKYRGGAPIPWAIINGETETGVTLFHLEDETDAGDIVSQTAFPILPEESWVDVYARATDASIALLCETLPLLTRGVAPRRVQDHSQATCYPQRSARDGLIDRTWGCRRIHNFIRAQTRPYPGAFILRGQKRITFWKSTVTTNKSPFPPGTLQAQKSGENTYNYTGGDGRILIINDATEEILE